MQILSKLIIKEWFKGLAGSVVILFLLISTADLLNGFLQGKESQRVFLEYILKMPDLMGKMFPICCLVSTLFSINKLKSHAELISIFASGFSYEKIYFLIGLCSTLVVSIQFCNLGFIEPYANKIKRQEIQKSRKSEGKYLTRSSIEGGRFWYKTQSYFASFSYFDRQNISLHDFEIYYFSPNYRGEKIIKSSSATFKKKGEWFLKKVVDISNLDTPSFPKKTLEAERTIQLDEAPEDFHEFEADLTTLDFIKLKKFVKRLSRTGINIAEYKILLLNKVFLSLICLIFALIPMSSIFNPNRRSSSFGKNVVTVLLISVVFWVMYSASLALGNSGSLPPLVATGLVPMLFLWIVLHSYFRNRKLST
jgi:lipopolysaccharide export system permease protein